MPYSDGTYTTATQDGPKRTFYPFVNSPTKDTTTKGTVRNYVVLPGSFTPASALSTDPDDATQYLIEETEPQIEAGIARFSRTYCKVPGDQVAPVAEIVSKPEVPGAQTFPRVLGDYLIAQPDSTLPKFDAYYRRTVAGDTGVPSYYPTGGTYTLTFAGNTTGALNYSDSAATVESALDALASVTDRGGVAVSGSYNSPGGLAVTFADYAQITLDASSLTGGAVEKTESNFNGGYSQSVSALLHDPLSSASIDITNVAISAGSASTGKSSSIASPDGFTRRFTISGTSTFNTPSMTGSFEITINGDNSGTISAYTTEANIQSALDAVAPGKYMVFDMSKSDGFGYVSYSFSVKTTYRNPTGGTFTLTAFASTTGAIAYNASEATIEAALDALAPVIARGGCSVSGGLASGISISFSNAAITATSSLAPTGSTVTPLVTDSGIGRTHSITFSSPTSTREIYSANHGIADGMTIFLKGGSTYYTAITNFVVTGVNTILLPISPSLSYAAASTITEVGPLTKQGYQPGSVRVPGLRTTKFYLPGVTSGIATAADIPIPTSAADSTSLLLAIFSGSNSLNVDVGDLQQWRGPILSLSSVAVNAADV